MLNKTMLFLLATLTVYQKHSYLG